MEINFLPKVVILISAAVLVVVLFKRFHLSPVLGYLVAGAAIGDHGFEIVAAKDTSMLAELGVVFLLFAIGLELSFERLKAMRQYVLGLGSLQVSITAVIISSSVILFAKDTNAAILIGGGLALSSTAIVLQVIEETRNQSTQVGRIGLAILLMQDFIVVPLLVIVPLLSNNDGSILQAVGISFLKAMVALVCIFIGGRLFLRPMFKLISLDKSESSNELFIAATLLIVLSAAWGTEELGLSLALGAFVAGILVAETEFRTQAEESIHPFKGLLLGLFFMYVGMTIDVFKIFEQIDKIIIFAVTLILVKSLIIIGLCRLFGISRSVSLQAGLLLAQGGEFAFILFKLGIESKVIDEEMGKMLMLIVTFTMALTPMLASLGKYLGSLVENKNDAGYTPLKDITLGTSDLNNHVIIAGFGQVGKMVAKVLEAEDVNYIALDINDKIVSVEKESGFPIFKGDISHEPTLKAAGASRALCIVLATENYITLKKSLKSIAALYPDLDIIVRSKDLSKSAELYESGATKIIPVDYETGLQIGGEVLKYADVSEYEIVRIKMQFRAGNYVTAQLDEDLFDEHEHD